MRTVDKAEVTPQVSPEMEQMAIQRAKDRVNPVRWDLDIAVFMFAVLIIVIILLFQEIDLEITAPIAIIGLALCWLIGWRRGRQLYRRYYDEELTKLELESRKTAEGTLEETLEEKVQKALRERWR